MYKYLFIVGLLSSVSCDEGRKHRTKDPFASLDRQITHTLVYHYLWPWSQLIAEAAAIEAAEKTEEPKIISDANKFEISLNVKTFKPDELKIKVKNRYIIVEGKNQLANDDLRLRGRHFVQRFSLPLGCEQEEVKAVLKDGVLSITAPKHEIPPPPPEREVPIEVLLPETATEKNVTPEKVEVEETTEKQEVPAVVTSTGTSLEQLHLTEATTHIGKIRKKELKTTTKTNKDNEVTKVEEGNGLDYALIEADE